MTNSIALKPAAALQHAVNLFQAGQVDAAADVCAQILKAQPHNFQALQLAGAIDVHRGRYAEGYKALKAALQQKPNAPRLLSNAGAACQRLGKLTQARKYLEKAVRLDPTMFNAFVNLATILNDLGDPDEASVMARTAIALNPQSHEGLNCLGAALIRKRDYPNAKEYLLKALERAPGDARVLSNLSLIALRLGDFPEAIQLANEGLAKPNAHIDLWTHKATALEQLNQFDQAIETWGEASNTYPDNPSFRLAKLNAFVTAGQNLEAIEFATQCLEKTPKDPDLLCGRARSLMDLNRLNEAQADYESALRSKPDHMLAHYSLGMLIKHKNNDRRLGKLLKLYDQSDMSDKDRIYLDFALSKIYGDIGNVSKEAKYLHAGNAKRKTTNAYNPSNDKKLMEHIKTAFEKLESSDAPDAMSARLGKRPIFVLGMPRSGTTLTEQILSSHSDVFGAGELTYLPHAMAKLLTDEANRDAPVSTLELRTIAGNYADRIERLEIQESVFVDKLPSNFRFIGFLLEMFPDAKIVHLNRDPRAVCWSIYKANFANAGNDFSSNLEDLAHYYHLYLDMMDYWRAKCPDSIYDLDYAQLTENQETETRRLIEQCGLDWEEACLNFHKNRRAVRTASHLQVRQKMYKGSSEAWRKYESHLSELLDGFEKYGVQLPD